MLQYVVRRLLLMVPVALIVAVAVFLLIHIVPGNPAAIILGELASPKAVAALDHSLGLDRPLPVQFVDWLWRAAHGDLGNSLVYSQPVVTLIVERLPVTFELTAYAMLLSLLIAVPAAVVSAYRRNSVTDYVARLLAFAGISVPSFWLALILIDVFALHARLFPATGYTPPAAGLGPNIVSLTLPAVTLAVGLAAVSARILRAELIESLEQAYVATARAKGLRERQVVLKHALKNALLPTVTVVGLQVGGLLGGVVITESIFSLPGMGQLVVNAIFQRDYPVVQGTVLFFALTVMVVNLIVDVLYALLDPRIQYA
jgi:peptide/nickel transport system permease protein